MPKLTPVKLTLLNRLPKNLSVDITSGSHGASQQMDEIYTPWAIKKGATFIFMTTLANVDRFQYFFHFWIRR